jgi:hypothetical protein
VRRLEITHKQSWMPMLDEHLDDLACCSDPVTSKPGIPRSRLFRRSCGPIDRYFDAHPLLPYQSAGSTYGSFRR